MLILRTNLRNLDKKVISKAVKILRAGGVIVYPTDTAYALGGIFNNEKAIKKILEIKKRTDRKFTLVAADLKQVQKFFKLNFQQLKLAKKYWPGALSIVVSDKFAVRVPDLEIARQLASGAGAPLIATSANISGETTPYEVSKVVSADLALDAGKLPKQKTSTIVKVEGDKIKIIREGAVRVNRTK